MFGDIMHIYGSFRDNPTTPLHPIESGEYTLLLIQEREAQRIRYAFLTADEAGQIRELDADELAAIVGDPAAAKIWNKGVQKIKIRKEGDKSYRLKDAHVELCDEGMVKKVLVILRWRKGLVRNLARNRVWKVKS